MRSRIPLLLLPALTLALALASTPALAADGVFEISQACAVNTGCFVGDTAGIPVTITASGSYRLTSNLIVPDENTDGIVISTSDVGIDLNNFAIIRSGCEGATTSCKPASGTGSGIDTSNIFYRGTSVKNGSITGMGSYGVLVGEQAEVANLRARWNLQAGIGTGLGSTVTGNTAYGNGSYGVFASYGSTVSGNTAYGNGSIGIWALNGSTLVGNTTMANGATGIQTGVGSLVSDNSALANTGDGIKVSSGSTVRGNAVRENAGYGINLTTTATYRENIATNNSLGPISSGINTGNNYCSGAFVLSTSCP